MTQPSLTGRPILLVGDDPSLEYLLKRYAARSGHPIRVLRDPPSENGLTALLPLSVWFSSWDVLEASQALQVSLAELGIPTVVCSSIADDSRAIDLGADYVFLHPITYDCFLSALTGRAAEKGRDM